MIIMRNSSFVDGKVVVAVATGKVFPTGAAFDDLARLVDTEVAIKHDAGGYELVGGAADFANAGAEWAWHEAKAETDETRGNLVRGGFAGRPVELEIVGVEILSRVKEESDNFEAEINKDEGEVELVEPEEAKEHDAGGSEEENDELVSVAKRFLEVEFAFANVDFGGGGDRVESIPLHVGNQGGESHGEGVLWTKLKGVADTEEKDEERDNVAAEGDGIVFDAVEEIKAEFELIPVCDEGEKCEDTSDGERNADDKELVLGEEGSADEADEADEIIKSRITVGAGVAAGVVELVEDEGENSLEHEVGDGIDDEEAVCGVDVHEVYVIVDIEKDSTVDEDSDDNAKNETRHYSVFVLVADTRDVGAGRER